MIDKYYLIDYSSMIDYSSKLREWYSYLSEHNISEGVADIAIFNAAKQLSVVNNKTYGGDLKEMVLDYVAERSWEDLLVYIEVNDIRAKIEKLGVILCNLDNCCVADSKTVKELVEKSGENYSDFYLLLKDNMKVMNLF